MDRNREIEKELEDIAKRLLAISMELEASVHMDTNCFEVNNKVLYSLQLHMHKDEAAKHSDTRIFMGEVIDFNGFLDKEYVPYGNKREVDKDTE